MPGDRALWKRITIEFDPTTTPIKGRVREDEAPAREFEGMLELFSVLEAARGQAARAEGDDPME